MSGMFPKREEVMEKKMKVELEITEKMMEEAIKRFSTKTIWGDGALSKVVEEIVSVTAGQYVEQQLKENKELRIYLEGTIQNSIHSAMQDMGDIDIEALIHDATPFPNLMNKRKKKTLEEVWEELEDGFDWKKVHKVMTFLDWKWATATTKDRVPSIEDLKKNARTHLASVMEYDEKDFFKKGNYGNVSSSSGGFVVIRHMVKGKKDSYELMFNVSRWDYDEQYEIGE